MSNEKYNGWSNRETWLVNLWMSNDEDQYNQYRELTRKAIDLHAPGSRVHALAGAIRVRHEGGMLGKTNVYTDLLSTALSAVNWSEIAMSWIEAETKQPVEGPGWEPAP